MIDKMNIQIEDLIGKLEKEFDEIEPGTLKSTTSFKDLEEWSSMQALIVIALVDEHYDITLTGNDLMQCKTVQDIYDKIKDK